jgi:hypothetical protein
VHTLTKEALESIAGGKRSHDLGRRWDIRCVDEQRGGADTAAQIARDAADALTRLAGATLKAQDGARTVLCESSVVEKAVGQLSGAIDEFVASVAARALLRCDYEVTPPAGARFLWA